MKSCDVARERVKGGRKDRKVYWWSVDLTELRQGTIVARRR